MAKETKEMVAVRLDPSDRRKLKAIAKRLSVKESGFMRYAIKAALEEFAPLTDQSLEGAELLAPFLQNPVQKWRWLYMDAAKLDDILHTGLEDESLRVARTDLDALVSGAGDKPYHDWLIATSTGKKPISWSMLTPSAYLQEKYVQPVRDEKRAAEEGAWMARQRSAK